MKSKLGFLHREEEEEEEEGEDDAWESEGADLPGVSDKCLRIPHAFLKHIEAETSTTVSLRVSGRDIWHVVLIKGVDGMLLQNGWQEFVKDNCIKKGHCPVFRYKGNLHFTVQIFVTTGCEWENSFDVNSCKTRNKVRGKSAKTLNVSSRKVFKSTLERNGKINNFGLQSSGCKKSIDSSKRAMKSPYQQTLSDFLFVYKAYKGSVSSSQSLREKPVCSTKRSMPSVCVRSTHSSRNNQLPVCQSLCKKQDGSAKLSMKKPSHQVQPNCSSRNNRLPVQRSLCKKPVNPTKISMKRPSRQGQSKSSSRSNGIPDQGSVCEKHVSSTKIKPSHQVQLNCSSNNKRLSFKRSLCKKPVSSSRESIKNSSSRVHLDKSSGNSRLTVQRSMCKKPVRSTRLSMKRSSCSAQPNHSSRNNQVAARPSSFRRPVRSTKISKKKPSYQDKDQFKGLTKINVKRKYQTNETFIEELSYLRKGTKRVSRSKNQ